jgi:hypothetical protein
MNIKNIDRVQKYGEVFTSQREVVNMLKLVNDECNRIESRFLEPACGSGNFLVEILKLKLVKVDKYFGRRQHEYEKNAILAISSIYGIDILEDNIEDCKENLFNIFRNTYIKKFKANFKQSCIDSALCIINRNIIWGDALTYKTCGPSLEPIVFTEWSFINNSMVQQNQYIFSDLLKEKNTQINANPESLIPIPNKTFKLMHFLEIH